MGNYVAVVQVTPRDVGYYLHTRNNDSRTIPSIFGHSSWYMYLLPWHLEQHLA